MRVTFTTVMEIPDDLVDEKGGIIASDDWGAGGPRGTTRRSYHGVPAWTEGREPVEHFAARLLVAYANDASRRVHARTRLRRRKARSGA